MKGTGSQGPHSVPDDPLVDQLSRLFSRAATPCAATRGPDHRLIYANDAFRRLLGGTRARDVPVGELFRHGVSLRLAPLLDRAFTRLASLDDRFLGRVTKSPGTWSCTIWPIVPADGRADGLVIQLHRTTEQRRSAALQREVAERLLISALRETEAAEAAEAALSRATVLSDASHSFGDSLEEVATREAITQLAPSPVGDWCIIDIIEPDGRISRLATVHPDPGKQALLSELDSHWAPQPGDPLGIPAVSRAAAPVIVSENIEQVLTSAAHTQEALRLLQQVGVGSLLSVPLDSNGRALGAITFVRSPGSEPYAQEDIELAQALAARAARALDTARRYGDALSLLEQAHATLETRMRHLGNISHELRTPLHAILGYVDLIDLGVHGDVTDAQRADLERIRANHHHLITLINDIAKFVRSGSARAQELTAMSVQGAATRALRMVESLAAEKGLSCRILDSDRSVSVMADPGSVQQILVNLLGNAIKFTPAGGEVTIGWGADADGVLITVADTGIGIPEDKIEAVFEPFVQVEPKTTVEAGAGLGLAISRDLARAMGGDLTAESVLGEGSRFTLCLPQADAGDSPPLESAPI